MPAKYKGILKIIFGIYTRCQQIHFFKVGKIRVSESTFEALV